MDINQTQTKFRNNQEILETPNLEPLEQDIETDEAGLEKEAEEINYPFDPTKIKINRASLTIALVLERIKYSEIDLSPNFQRDSDIWNDVTKSRLIESILIRIPLPAFYLDATDENKWIVIDGQQRLTAIKNFVLGEQTQEEALPKKLRLSQLEFLDQFNNKTYDELPRNYQRRINETEITLYLIEPGTPVNVKYNIFKRINTGGTPLSLQEIRHALNQGKVTELLKALAHSKEFKTATDNAVKDKRMAAREVVLHFLAFKLISFNEYDQEEFDTFLNDTMKKINRMSDSDIQNLKESFFRAMNIAIDLFGKDAFRKRKDVKASRSPVNKALFESWSVSLSCLSDDRVKLLQERREILINKFIELNKDPKFIDSISGGNGASRRVKYRFSKIQEIIETTLDQKLY